MKKRRQEIEFWQTANGFNRLECSDADAIVLHFRLSISCRLLV